MATPRSAPRSKQKEAERRPIMDRSWDEVDQASWESFPASDPPGWALPDSHKELGHPKPPSASESADPAD